MRKRRWTLEQLKLAVKKATSIRQVLKRLSLVEAGGNYEQIKHALYVNNIDCSHFTGRGWRRGKQGLGKVKIPLERILTKNSTYQSYKLKQRLFTCRLKQPICEECGWEQVTPDGRIPVELDHINGDSHDNRLENLRILCPNCHSLKPTHRGKNKHKARW